MKNVSPLSGRETSFEEGELIVSKTDIRGIITYVNDVFVRVSGYSEKELLGSPHNIIRHPRMPRAVFKLLWDTIKGGEEVFAYVLNRSKNGDEYWVFAHVTPSYDAGGKIIGYHSNRRSPYRDALRKVEKLYTEMLEEEAKFRPSAEAAAAGLAVLERAVAAGYRDYAEFVFALSRETSLSGGGR